MYDLKPCIGCGKKPTITRRSNKLFKYVVKHYCSHRKYNVISYQRTKEECINMWNMFINMQERNV